MKTEESRAEAQETRHHSDFSQDLRVHLQDRVRQNVKKHKGVDTWIRVNDPSAGSPTETLLRLLLPLNDQV